MLMVIVAVITIMSNIPLGIALSVIGLATIALSITGILLEDDLKTAFSKG